LLWCNCGKASLSFQFKTSKNLKTAQIGYTVLKVPLPSTSSYCNATSQTHVRNSKILGSPFAQYIIILQCNISNPR
jgi:hypothetical protein